jgi:hypothetical protein
MAGDMKDSALQKELTDMFSAYLPTNMPGLPGVQN